MLLSKALGATGDANTWFVLSKVLIAEMSENTVLWRKTIASALLGGGAPGEKLLKVHPDPKPPPQVAALMSAKTLFSVSTRAMFEDALGLSCTRNWMPRVPLLTTLFLNVMSCTREPGSVLSWLRTFKRRSCPPSPLT